MKIKLVLPLDDVNLILSYLGQAPFLKVANLITAIQNQANAAVAENNAEQVEKEAPKKE